MGQLLFYDPTAIDPRFDDPGGWFNCSGTLVSPTVVVTAGHCTFGTGLNGEPTASGSGGNDVWISFAEVPDYSILPPSSEFIPDDNEGRYQAWSAALNASDEWIRATAYPHPDYDDAAFFEHDLGVLVLDEPVILSQYGQLPTLGLLDRLYAENKQQPYTAVGYGLEGSGPKTSFGGDTRRRAELRLVNLNGVLGSGKGTSAKFSSNANTGGTCFGDSGGRSSSPARPPWWLWCRSGPAPPALAPAAPTASTRRTTWPSWRPLASPPEGGAATARPGFRPGRRRVRPGLTLGRCACPTTSARRPVDLESDWRRDESADVALDVADDVDCRAVLQMGLGYAAVVLGLGRLLPQGSSLVVPGATLAVAAVFQPARRRIQQGVDRRFNRRRHDAARTIEAFGVRLRDQVDLDGLRGELLGVVEDTMQPTRVSLWLRQPQAPVSS